MAGAIFNPKVRYGVAIYLTPKLNDEDSGPYTQSAGAQGLQILQNDMIVLICGVKKTDYGNTEKKGESTFYINFPIPSCASEICKLKFPL